jgi:hypothetical protein
MRNLLEGVHMDRFALSSLMKFFLISLDNE